MRRHECVRAHSRRREIPFEIVAAECDIVTVIHKNNRQDPTAAPGRFYEVFTFDTFRVRNGKLVEHWDGAVINPQLPPQAEDSREWSTVKVPLYEVTASELKKL
jgi:predicted SnoaL-like aldol condensation-catalyzing enzyme